MEFQIVTNYLGLIRIMLRNTENYYFILPHLNCTTKKVFNTREFSYFLHKKPVSRKVAWPMYSTSSVTSAKWVSFGGLFISIYTQTTKMLKQHP